MNNLPITVSTMGRIKGYPGIPYFVKDKVEGSVPKKRKNKHYQIQKFRHNKVIQQHLKINRF